MKGDALISGCGNYRYWLSRTFKNTIGLKGPALFVMLNPSTADASLDDPTIRRCLGFAKSWGCLGLTVANLYAYRATKPSRLWEIDDPEGPQNDEWILRLMRDHTHIVGAWGVNAKPERVERFKKLADDANVRIWCLGTTKNGSPRHPLYIRADQPLIKWG